MAGPQSQKWSLAAVWSWISPWPQVAAQAFQIQMWPAAVWSLVATPAPGGDSDLRPPFGPMAMGARDLNPDSGCGRATDSEMAPSLSSGMGINMALGGSAGHAG